MPLYEYKCECGREFEEFHPMSECERARVCPGCGGEGRRVVSMRVSGKGWNADKLYRHLPGGARRFASKGDLKNFCKNEGVVCGEVEDLRDSLGPNEGKKITSEVVAKWASKKVVQRRQPAVKVVTT